MEEHEREVEKGVVYDEFSKNGSCKEINKINDENKSEIKNCVNNGDDSKVQNKHSTNSNELKIGDDNKEENVNDMDSNIIGVEGTGTDTCGDTNTETNAKAVNEDILDEMFDDFLKDIESVITPRNKNQEKQKRFKKEDVGTEIARILANKNNSAFTIFDIVNEDVNMEIIKNKYKQLSILIHPDKCDHKNANEAFHILNKAYEELKQDEVKEQYKNVYEIAKKNIIKKLKLPKKKKNEINEYFNIQEEEYDITKEIQQQINEECERLLKERQEKQEYAQKCKMANLRYAQEKEEERLKEELKKEEERKKWNERRDERVNSWKSYKQEIFQNEKEFQLFKIIGKKKEERTEEEKELLKKITINTIDLKHPVNKKRKKKSDVFK
ncbi:DnaJ protein, putative [Hepatocystis sp. ex Piliocolobus tephrosceles]|nr:DnaJ protein, putative [Hepatocystis sp. ex Piliocolobus tephrosceles]